MARIVVAMSGGVDSSVAVWLLRQAGHEVVGLFMRHGLEPDPACDTAARAGQGCCSAADAHDARRVADALGVPFYALNFEAEFARIVDYFVAEYTAGRTPNPCIVCNHELKFGKLFDYADSIGAEFVATGHYARREVADPSGEPALYQAVDPSKDQSYVLFGIPRHRMARVLLPVGSHSKSEIRAIAGQLGLRVADKPDSQEICFVPDDDHARFVRARRGGDTSGPLVTSDGRVVGHHDGIERFTVGQRKGLGVAFGEPRYVIRVEPDTRSVVIGTHEELARWELTAARANWLVDPWPEPRQCAVKIRYRSRAVPSTVTLLDAGRFAVRFHEPCYAVAPGQAAVCYDGQRVLGGGWIE